MTSPQDGKVQQTNSSTVGTLVYLLLGPILWGVQFTAVYMVHTLVCTIGAAASIASTFVLLFSAAVVLALAAALFNGDKLARALGVGTDSESRTTYDGIFLINAVISIVAIAWSGATVLIVTACR